MACPKVHLSQDVIDELGQRPWTYQFLYRRSPSQRLSMQFSSGTESRSCHRECASSLYSDAQIPEEMYVIPVQCNVLLSITGGYILLLCEDISVSLPLLIIFVYQPTRNSAIVFNVGKTIATGNVECGREEQCQNIWSGVSILRSLAFAFSLHCGSDPYNI